MRRATIVILSVAALVAVATRAPSAAQPRPVPKLVVLIVVDQMRADYVERFQTEWTGGLERLVHDGAWFRRAAYPYLTTVTCAGHATVSTGAFPRTHGIIQNGWWDRDRQAAVTCTADPQVKNLGYGMPATGGDSAHELAVPTLADIMRTERGSHVATVALKARSAIMLAGHGGHATWLAEDLSGWETSSAFGDGRTVPSIASYLAANPIDADFGKTWNLLLPLARYHEPDEAPGEAAPRPWTRTFPHLLNSASGQPDAQFHGLWERSPYADEYVGRFAAALVQSERLGQHDATDVLGISFSTPDLVGHGFGPRSREMHDIYAHLDRTLGALFDRLDTAVGRHAYVVALSADHGVTDIPEQLVSEGRDAGRIDPAAIARTVESNAAAALGPGMYLARVVVNDIYFLPGIYDRLAASPGALDAIVRALGGVPGVRTAFTAEQVRAGGSSTDAVLHAATLSYFPGRSGDLILVPKPGWMFATTGTTHGTASEDDQRVPVIFYGAGVKPGVYGDAATPADVTPTIAAVLGIRMPRADGHPLSAALLSKNATF